jgi:hypothetical protein
VTSGGGLNELARRLVPRGRLLAQLLHGLSRLADLVVGRGVVRPVAAVPGSVGPALGVVVVFSHDYCDIVRFGISDSILARLFDVKSEERERINS